jgi:catechol 2,3-dioxygenase-like lactoylglutathione lyase family enzyme
MIDHVSIPVRDLRAAGEFYDAVLAPVGLCRLVARDATIGFGKRYPEFWLNSRPHHVPADNPGTHICLRALNSEAVEAFHARAMVLGAKNEGTPAERAGAMSSYFGAFIIDFDGNKIEARPWSAIRAARPGTRPAQFTHPADPGNPARLPLHRLRHQRHVLAPMDCAYQAIRPMTSWHPMTNYDFRIGAQLTVG